jgi:uncharacterized delta-60 repeat protein
MRSRRQAGTITQALALAAASLAMFAPGASAVPGEPDPSFGAGGIAEPLPPNSGSSLSALGFEPGGAIDAIGTYSPSDEYEVLALRLTESGALDPTFGSGGWEHAYFVEHVEHSLALESGNAEMVRADGSIVVGSSGVVGRLLPSGATDTAFQKGPRLEYRALAPRGDGSVVAAGETEDVEHPSNGDFPAVAAFGPNGEPDTAFAGGGHQVIPLLAGDEWSGKALDAIALEGGETLLAGWASTFAKGSRIVWVARLQANGSLDPSFGSDGIFRVPVSGSEAGVALARQPSGRIILFGERSTSAAGPFSEPGYQTIAWGLSPNGLLDTSFGTDGEAVIPDTSPELSGSPEAAQVDSAGRILVAADQLQTNAYDGAPLLARLTPSGRLDPSYGHGGEATGPAAAEVRALAIDTEGRAIIAGSISGIPYVERFTGEGGSSGPAGSPAPGFVALPERHGPKRIATRWSCHRERRHASRRRCALDIQILLKGFSATEARVSRGRRHIASAHPRQHGGVRKLSLELTASDKRTTYALRLTLRDGRHVERVETTLVLPSAPGPRR